MLGLRSRAQGALLIFPDRVRYLGVVPRRDGLTVCDTEEVPLRSPGDLDQALFTLRSRISALPSRVSCAFTAPDLFLKVLSAPSENAEEIFKKPETLLNSHSPLDPAASTYGVTPADDRIPPRRYIMAAVPTARVQSLLHTVTAAGFRKIRRMVPAISSAAKALAPLSAGTTRMLALFSCGNTVAAAHLSGGEILLIRAFHGIVDAESLSREIHGTLKFILANNREQAPSEVCPDAGLLADPMVREALGGMETRPYAQDLPWRTAGILSPPGGTGWEAALGLVTEKD
jgi:hypothetical protein